MPQAQYKRKKVEDYAKEIKFEGEIRELTQMNSELKQTVERITYELQFLEKENKDLKKKIS